MILEDTLEPEYKPVLDFWFGSVEKTWIPTEDQVQIWFGDSPKVDQTIAARFKTLHQEASVGARKSWQESAHGQLALILVFDQFSRHLFRNSSQAFHLDPVALKICLDGLGRVDHELSLIERVFFYFPLLHAEQLEMQEISLQCYDTLLSLALPETTVVYDSFLRFASHHYSLIKQFGRFPQRNQILERKSTPEEIAYLKEQEEE
jgi:uncharacterized protein (DUF924 family)